MSTLIRLLQAHVLLAVVAAVVQLFARMLAEPTLASPRLSSSVQRFAGWFDPILLRGFSTVGLVLLVQVLVLVVLNELGLSGASPQASGVCRCEW